MASTRVLFVLLSFDVVDPIVATATPVAEAVTLIIDGCGACVAQGVKPGGPLSLNAVPGARSILSCDCWYVVVVLDSCNVVVLVRTYQRIALSL